jgi:DNA-directed RNA polymerase alpha subunit
MQIEVHAPPETLRRSYTDFLNRIREEAGGWVSVPLTEVAGQTTKAKQSVIISASKNHKLRVQTTVQRGRIYVRYMGDVCL